MKKIFILFSFLIITITASAETLYYRAVMYQYRHVKPGSEWIWDDPVTINQPVVINTNNNTITINNTQNYTIYGTSNTKHDGPSEIFTANGIHSTGTKVTIIFTKVAGKTYMRINYPRKQYLYRLIKVE